MFRFGSKAVRVMLGVSAFALMASPVLASGNNGQAVTLNPVIDPTSLSTAIFTLGGAALVAAFGVGGAFRIAKKVYNWMFSKV